MPRRIAPRHAPAHDLRSEDGVHITDLPIDTFARKLEVTPCGHRRWKALCPCHRDTNASLSISETEGGDLLMMCHACHATGDAVAAAVGLPSKYLFASDYARAHNARGVVLSASARPAAEKRPFYERMAAVMASASKDLAAWAVRLGVTEESLELLRCGCLGESLFTPEVDHRGRVVGVATRELESSKKRCLPESVRGLYIPTRQVTEDGPLYIAEGMSDTAALLSVGVRAIGRSQALTRDRQVRWLVKYLLREHDALTPVIVVADNDESQVGWRGAVQLSRTLLDELPDYEIRWAMPWCIKSVRYKDVRDQIRAGDWKRGLHVHQVRTHEDRAAKRRPK